MKNTAARGSLFVVAAPSGAGKTTLTRALLDNTDDLYLSVSHTTRAPRVGEQTGREYHFVSRETFDQMIERQEFLEHAQVFGFEHSYGTSKAAVEHHLAQGQDVLLEIDWQGAQWVKQVMPEAQSIFILPPSRQELERRLTGRGTDSAEVIAARMSTAENEMKHWSNFDYLIVNDDFDVALTQMQAIISARRCLTAHQAASNRDLLQQLLPNENLG